MSISKVPNYPDDMPEWMKDQKPILDFEYVTVPQLLATFPGLSIFSVRDGELVRLTEEGASPSTTQSSVLLQICRRGAVNSLLAVIRLRLRTMTRSRSAELPYHWLESL